jgi:hypothetical protein
MFANGLLGSVPLRYKAVRELSGNPATTSSLPSWIRLAGQRPSVVISEAGVRRCDAVCRIGTTPVALVAVFVVSLGLTPSIRHPSILSAPVPHFRTLAATEDSLIGLRARQIGSVAGFRAVP